MNKLIFLFAVIFLIGFASAQESDTLGTFKQTNCVNLIQTCANCSFVNISSVLYPNSSQALGQIKMQKTGTYYNYSFSDTNTLGIYRVNGFGDLDYPGIFETFSYTFTIKPVMGIESNSVSFLMILVTGLVILFIAFIFKNYIFSTISGFAIMAAGVYGIIYGFGDITNNFTRIVSFIIVGLGMIIAVTSSFEVMDDMSGGDSPPQDIPEEEE